MAFKKHFTVTEANSLVPRLLQDVPRIQGLAARLTNEFPDVEKARENARFNGGSVEGTAYLQVALQLNRAMNDLSDQGCIIKGIAEGLVDFPAILDGREVFLCWKIPEEEVLFWHDLDDGFAGRQKL